MTIYTGKIKYDYLNMTYLEHKSSIFAIRSTYDITGNNEPPPINKLIWRDERCTVNTQCGIFNIDTHDWTDIKDFNYIKYFQKLSFDCSVCHDNDDSIYVFDHAMYYTSKYDLNKNKWYTVSKEDKEMKNQGWGLIAFWYDYYMLYGMAYNTFTMQLQPMMQPQSNFAYQLMTLDLRDKDKKWNANGIDFDGLNGDRFYQFFG